MKNDPELQAVEDVMFEAVKAHKLPSLTWSKVLVMDYSVTSPGAADLRHDVINRLRREEDISYEHAKERVQRMCDGMNFIVGLDHDHPEVPHPTEKGPDNGISFG